MTEAELREKIFTAIERHGAWLPRASTNDIMDIVAPLLADAERLDWWETNPGVIAKKPIGWGPFGEKPHGLTLRDAIDLKRLSAEHPEEKPDAH